MPENYIDKIKKDNVEYDIHASNGGTKLYKHEVSFSCMDYSYDNYETVEAEIISPVATSLAGKQIPTDVSFCIKGWFWAYSDQALRYIIDIDPYYVTYAKIDDEKIEKADINPENNIFFKDRVTPL